MDTAILFDCEFLVSPGAPQRFWCGPYDPDPVVVQTGAVKLALHPPFDVIDTFKCCIRPIDRHGAPMPVDPFFTQLTGLTAEQIAQDGLSLQQANVQLAAFAQDATLWSWGKDEINLMAISCYIAGIPPALPARRFRNACDLLLAAGMPYDDLKTTRSNTLAAYFGLTHPDLKGHDALDDALSVTYVVQHLLRSGALKRGDFQGQP